MSTFNIFVGYRRKDTAGEAGRMCDRLVAAFEPNRVFKDADSIDPGVPFREHIISVVQSAEVFLALIGERWEEYLPRLEDPEDWVRMELEIALNVDFVQVIPVLIGDAKMPAAEKLPEAIRGLVGLQAVKVRQDPDFHPDMDRLIKKLSSKDVSGAVEVHGDPKEAERLSAWAAIENSMKRIAYEKFAEQYPKTREGKFAANAAKALQVWSSVDQHDIKEVKSFANKIEGKVPEALSRTIGMRLRILIRDQKRRRDYIKYERARDLDILGLLRHSTKEEWCQRFEDWKRELSPARFPPKEHPEIAQKLRRITLAYNRLVEFG